VWLVNAKDVKAPAGAPEDGPAGRGLVVQGRRASDDPPQLRPAQADPPAGDLTRYRAALVTEASAEKNRVEKLLEDAQIKLRSSPRTSSGSPAGT